jgi:6-phosphogluconate dehydrogenase
MCDLASLTNDRQDSPRAQTNQPPWQTGPQEAGPRELRNALYAATIITYAQAMALLQRASVAHCYDLDLRNVVHLWRGGSPLRARILEFIESAFLARADLSNLLLDARIASEIRQREADLRRLVRQAAGSAVPAPALMASLAYWDSSSSARRNANWTEPAET